MRFHLLQNFALVSLLLIVATPATLLAQDGKADAKTTAETDTKGTTTDSDPSKSGASVEERLEVLEESIENLKLDKAVKKYKSVGGLGPAASGVYNTSEGFSFGGYGEIKYHDYQSKHYKTDQVDVHRLILYTGYRFNDWIVMNAEIEYEHVQEVFVEFAYIDLLFSDKFQLATGLLLVPMGITNYMHEPTTFHSVNRPETEKNIIPSTWREVGVLAKGQLGDFHYKTGVLSGLKASSFSDSSWIRGGRQKGGEAKAEDWAFVAAIDYKLQANWGALLAGGSFYHGDAGQGEIADYDPLLVRVPTLPTTDGTGLIDAFTEYNTNRKKTGRATVRMAEAHYKLDIGPFTTRGLFARGWMDERDVRAINKATGKNIGVVVEGGYVEAGFNIFSILNLPHKLYVFVRAEHLNTQKETVRSYAGDEESILNHICATYGGACSVASNAKTGVINASDTGKELYGIGGIPDRVNDRRILTSGVAYFPHDNVVFKMDYSRWSSKSNYHKDVEWRNSSNNKIDQIHMSVGFIF